MREYITFEIRMFYLLLLKFFEAIMNDKQICKIAEEKHIKNKTKLIMMDLNCLQNNKKTTKLKYDKFAVRLNISFFSSLLKN
jgi:hypothetical protein